MNSKKYYLIYSLCIIALVVAITISLTKQRHITLTSGTHILMGTTVRVTVVATKKAQAQDAINKAIASITATEKMMSYYSDSELNTINTDGFERAVNVSDELFELIKKSVRFCEITGGAFDCTISPVLELWRQAAKTGIKPTDQQLATAKSKTGCDKLIINDSDKTIRFAVEGMRIDLGGIAKGHAIDKAIEVMTGCGVAGGLIDAGGDIKCFGLAANKRQGWHIGLQNPHTDDADNVILQFTINDTAVTTSGDYYRFVVIEDEKVSHIIDPATKHSARELTSVSVIAKDATTADALSTAVTVLGKEKGKALIDSLDNVEAMLITSTGEIIKTKSIQKYLKD